MPHQQVQTIEVKVSPKFSNYLISIPLHHTQQVVKIDNEGWMHLRWQLMVNQELISELLRFGQDVVVLSPSELVETLVNNLKTSLEKYA
jgi:predicted DNA-binding transcriptional regulator YafY